MAPWKCKYPKEAKSVCKSGKKPSCDREYFEILCLCVLQAGLNWRVIRENWQRYRGVFEGFDFERLSVACVDDLICKPNAIRNRRKIEAIIYNANEFKRIVEEYGSFEGFLEELKRKGKGEVLKIFVGRFKHVGIYTAEYFLHSVGFWRA
ncbi:MAG: DNA-3-methyladenine glycosylase I [Candidatus Bathyarchaeia archaeon]